MSDGPEQRRVHKLCILVRFDQRQFKDLLKVLFDGQNVWNIGGLWRFDQGNVLPGLSQNPLVKELQPIQVDLDRAP
jgi:hypothetical protein